MKLVDVNVLARARAYLADHRAYSLSTNASDYVHIQEAGYALRLESWR
jgi:hypothetical protein